MTPPADATPERPPDETGHAREAKAALARAQELLRAARALDAGTREEVLAALGDLDRALGPALAERAEDARSVTHFAETVAHEATHPAPSRSILTISLEGLNEAAERLEQRHPTLAGIAKRMSDALAQIGI